VASHPCFARYLEKARTPNSVRDTLGGQSRGSIWSSICTERNNVTEAGSVRPASTSTNRPGNETAAESRLTQATARTSSVTLTWSSAPCLRVYLDFVRLDLPNESLCIVRWYGWSGSRRFG
jgi:hypothetical protein